MIKLFVVTILLQFAYSHGLNIQPRIINGYRSNPEDFKFFARVVTFFENSPLNGLCGSSLISDSFVFVLFSQSFSSTFFLCSSDGFLFLILTDGFSQRHIVSPMRQELKYGLELMQRVISLEPFQFHSKIYSFIQNMLLERMSKMLVS